METGHLSPSKLPAEIRNALDLIKQTVTGFDRVTFLVDHPKPDIPASEIERHCSRLTITVGRSLSYHPMWQTTVDVFQPSDTAFSLLATAMGTRHATRLRYAELAIDWLVDTPTDAYSFRRFILGHVHVPYLRHNVGFAGMTAYFSPRTDQDTKKKNARNIVLYADRTSKLWSARQLHSPCCHLEYRLQGAGTLAAYGLLTLADCAHFDHHAFWAKNLRLYHLPKMAELGRWLRPDSVDMTDAALRKRANLFLSQYRHNETFVLQNCWRDAPGIDKLLQPLPNELFLPT